MPLSTYICFLLRKKRTKAEAGAEAHRLGVRLDLAEQYWRSIG